MESTSRPELITRNGVLKPLLLAQESVNDASTRIAAAVDDGVLWRAFFIMAISAVETSMVSLLRHFLKVHPEKMEFAELTLNRQTLLSSELVSDILAEHVERYVRKKSLGSLSSLLAAIESALGLGTIPSNLRERLEKARSKRNAILHVGHVLENYAVDSQLRIERLSLRWESDPAELSASEVNEHLDTLSGILSWLRERLEQKYDGYTRIRAIRALWDYHFSSPVMQFDEYWKVDVSEDKVIAAKTSPYEKRLSSTERMLLGLWRRHLGGDASMLSEMQIRSFDDQRFRRLIAFLTILRDGSLF